MKRLLFKWALSLIQWIIVNDHVPLQPDDLIAKGWITDFIFGSNTYFEKDIKEELRIFIRFDQGYYRAYFGKNFAFISLETSAKWLELFLLIRDKHRRIINLNR